jgi:hypothetical protein
LHLRSPQAVEISTINYGNDAQGGDVVRRAANANANPINATGTKTRASDRMFSSPSRQVGASTSSSTQEALATDSRFVNNAIESFPYKSPSASRQFISRPPSPHPTTTATNAANAYIDTRKPEEPVFIIYRNAEVVGDAALNLPVAKPRTREY